MSRARGEVALKALGDHLEAIWSVERWRWAKAIVMTRAGLYGEVREGGTFVVFQCRGAVGSKCQLLTSHRLLDLGQLSFGCRSSLSKRRFWHRVQSDKQAQHMDLTALAYEVANECK